MADFSEDFEYEADDSQSSGTLLLNETLAAHMPPPVASRDSAQYLAQCALEEAYQVGNMAAFEYQAKLRELRQSVKEGVDSGSTCTQGIVSALRNLYAAGFLAGRWYFISVDCDHFASEFWEQSYACLYRNAQTVLSALYRLPDFRKRLFGSIKATPSVWKLQVLLEAAWKSGFDPSGANQAAQLARSRRGPSTSGTSTTSRSNGLIDSTIWLGTTDLAALLGSIGVRCCLVECLMPSGPLNTHPSLLEHICTYIKSSCNEDGFPDVDPLTYSLPIYLQHEGHSRIVVGVQVNEDGCPIALMVLDPSTPAAAMQCVVRAAAVASRRFPSAMPSPPVNQSAHGPTVPASNAVISENTDWEEFVHDSGAADWAKVVNSMRVDITCLNQPQYELLQMDGLIETETDLQDAMFPENISIAIS